MWNVKHVWIGNMRQTSPPSLNMMVWVFVETLKMFSGCSLTSLPLNSLKWALFVMNNNSLQRGPPSVLKPHFECGVSSAAVWTLCVADQTDIISLLNIQYLWVIIDHLIEAPSLQQLHQTCNYVWLSFHIAVFINLPTFSSLLHVKAIITLNNNISVCGGK